MFPIRRTAAPDELEEIWDEIAEALEKIYVNISEKKDSKELIEVVREHLKVLEVYGKLRGK